VNCFTSVGPYGWIPGDTASAMCGSWTRSRTNRGSVDQARAGIDHITIDDNPAVFNPNGGVGISIRNVDTLVVRV